MRSTIHHSFDDAIADGLNHYSRYSDARPLIVNCAGAVNLPVKFETNNRRGREDFYLMYIINDNLKIHLDEGDVMAKPGDFIIFPPHYKYRYSFSGSGTLSYYYVHYTGERAEELLSDLFLTPIPTVRYAGHSAEAAQGFAALFEAYARNDEFRDITLASSLMRVLIALASSERQASFKRPLARSMTYINSKYTTDIKISDLAEMEGLSVSRYNVVFKEQNGTSPLKYMITLRMNHASTLLATTNLPINEIGEIVGYPDNHFFSKLFKKHIGTSPQKYRKSANNE